MSPFLYNHCRVLFFLILHLYSWNNEAVTNTPELRFEVMGMWFKDFPGGPVVETLCFHCRSRGFSPWPGRQACCTGQPGANVVQDRLSLSFKITFRIWERVYATVI